MSVRDLPTLNACLNGAAALCLLFGYWSIKVRKDERAHKRAMLAATACSALFLVSYLTYHAQVGSRPYQGTGTIRIVYFAILISHTILAAVNVPMIVTTLVLAFRDRRERHRKWARRTFPIWLYVSLTGIVVYLMLYVFEP
ncbi:MAG: DUF420 domain-containing protein [Planctomycetota bacterium JB042]